MGDWYKFLQLCGQRCGVVVYRITCFMVRNDTLCCRYHQSGIFFCNKKLVKWISRNKKITTCMCPVLPTCQKYSFTNYWYFLRWYLLMVYRNPRKNQVQIIPTVTAICSTFPVWSQLVEFFASDVDFLCIMEYQDYFIHMRYV